MLGLVLHGLFCPDVLQFPVALLLERLASSAMFRCELVARHVALVVQRTLIGGLALFHSLGSTSMIVRTQARLGEPSTPTLVWRVLQGKFVRWSLSSPSVLVERALVQSSAALSSSELQVRVQVRWDY